MYYKHISQPDGDAILQTLSRIRERLGEKWSANMACYAINKAWNIPPLKWRESCCPVEYQHIQFMEV